MRNNPNIIKSILNLFGCDYLPINNAPSHLSWLFVSTDKKTRKLVQKEYGVWTNVFKLDLSFKEVDITNINNEGKFEQSKIFAVVDYRGKKILVFDKQIHGYNGQMNVFEDVEVEEEQIDCVNFKSLVDEMVCDFVFAFQYSKESIENISEGNSALPEDYFDWIVIYKKCGNDLTKIFEHECA